MLAESTEPRQTAAADSREHVRHLVEEACEPVAQFWPMKRFVHHNPIHGLEHLPFDEAVRDAERLLGGRGYLPNREYRQFYQMGRISAPSVAAALERRGPTDPTAARVAIGGRHIESSDVWRAQLLFGMEALEPLLLAWTLGASGAVRRFQDDLPAESRRCILDRLTNPAGAGGAGAEARYVRGLETLTHDRAFDGVLAVRCWRGWSNGPPSPNFRCAMIGRRAISLSGKTPQRCTGRFHMTQSLAG